MINLGFPIGIPTIPVTTIDDKINTIVFWSEFTSLGESEQNIRLTVQQKNQSDKNTFSLIEVQIYIKLALY